MPTTGSGSLLCGMGRVCMVGLAWAEKMQWKAFAALPAAASVSRWRRVITACIMPHWLAADHEEKQEQARLRWAGCWPGGAAGEPRNAAGFL